MNTILFSLLGTLVAGLMGSTHCLGMCGGVATLAGSRAGQPRFGQVLAFNLGRLGSYAGAGALVGGLGWHLGAPLGSAAWGNLLRVATGGLMIAIGLQVATNWGGLRRLERIGVPLWRRLNPLIRSLDPTRSDLHAAAFGALWGWIPCGLVYSALMTALVSGGASTGALLMLAFGIGTLPAMLTLGLFGQNIRQSLTRHALRRTAGALVIAAGVWTATGPWLISSVAGHHHPVASSALLTTGRGLNGAGDFGHAMETRQIEHRHGTALDSD